MDSPSWPGNLPSDREKAIGELLEGRHFAFKLKAFLLQSGDDNNNNNNNESSLPPQDLLLKVLNSFTNTLSILSRPDSDEVSQFPASSVKLAPPYSDARKSEDSGDSCRSSSATKDRRGRYKRRKNNAHTWTRDTPDLVDDGHAWRKYGQKVILNAKYPRNYYRCTHKYDQGCAANKQVQRIEEDPPLYRTIYNGNHTCENFLKANHVYIESDYDANDDSSILLRFNCSNNNQHDHPFFTIKQDDNHQLLPINNQQSSSSDYFLSATADDQAVNNSSSCTIATAADDNHHSFDMDHLIHHKFDVHDDDVDVFAVCI